MFRCRDASAVLAVTVLSLVSFAADAFPGIGRPATPKEVAAWDIDVRPDFKGLPPGSGSVTKGQDVWESKCASCHGVFGESNSVFSPLVGGTSAADVKSGRAAKLTDTSYPGRTTLMKVPTLSTLWDYINRAMPWTEPKSLTTEEVYAVTAYLLNLGGVVPDTYVLSHTNMAETQKLLPNRNGMSTDHALWPGSELGGRKKPDVVTVACMTNCGGPPKIESTLPGFVRNAHGNLAEQNRPVGPQLGADTTQPEPAALGKAPRPALVAEARQKPSTGTDAGSGLGLAQQHMCTACHAVDKKLIGPSFQEIAKKYPGQADHVAARIKSGGSGVWGPTPMPAQSLNEADAKAIAKWLTTGPFQ